MNIKLNINLKDFNPSVIGFYEYILQEQSNKTSTLGALAKPPDAIELFKIIANDFQELHKPTTLAGILKIIHLTIEHTTTSTLDISNFLKNLLANHSAKEEDHLIATQIVYQVLSSLSNKCDVEKFHMSGFIREIIRSCNEQACAKVQTQLALCASLLIEKFKIDDLLETIWRQILTKKSHYVLVHYIDFLISKNHIYQNFEFWQLIEILLAAENRDDRKLGIFLVRSILKHLSTSQANVKIDKYFSWSEKSSNQLLTSWLTYFTILENLEEKQSHLILPSLETLDSVSLGENTPWIRIVLQQMLRHNNTLVLRWSVDYLYRNFKNLVLENHILQEFLQATNNTWLYNEATPGVFILPVSSLNDQQMFLKEFAKIPWKSVPMHVWLERLKASQWSGVECKVITNIASRLRQLQNRHIRSKCRETFIAIFESSIVDIPLNDFMNFLDALYSSTDRIAEGLLRALVEKIQTSACPYISFNMYSILRWQQIPFHYEPILMDAFDKVKVEDHHWFSLLVRFGFSPSDRKEEFCKKHYNISEAETLDQSLENAISLHVSNLSWDDISKAVVREATLDWYTARKAIYQSNYEDLVDGGGFRTLVNLTGENKRFKMDTAMLDRFIAELKILVKRMVDTDLLVWNLIVACAEDLPEFLYKYVNQILDIDVTNNRLALNVFQSVLSYSDHSKAEARQLLIRGLLFGEPLNGDLRIEHDYAIRIQLSQDLCDESSYQIRQTCLRFLANVDDVSRKSLVQDLIDQSRIMSIKKPRYFENSKHHRIKLRIAQALAALNKKESLWNDYYLFAILNENNQANVTYIYEFIVAATISESEVMKQMENLKNLTASCQISMFAMSYLFTTFHGSSKPFINKFITLLLPWTMGSNFNTRLYAQITVHHLLQLFQVTEFDYLKTAIETSLRESPNAYEKLVSDVRYNFPQDFGFLNTDPILYVTCVVEDEHPSWQLKDCNDCESLKIARNLNLAKREPVKETKKETLLSEPVIDDVQRKMNPEIGVNVDRTSGIEVPTTDMIVVASLIDKLPNLGGIARTCEVLGIKNLVLDSTKHVQNKEFKNLSMTAENWINLFEVKPKDLREFLLNKKTEGYQVVGAEQTAKSVNFMEFKFPTKCILLLGHEKEGIPADLIAFLDYAVEIPQFGMVRSLNVHVTGALFMYEYCKQLLCKTKVE